MIAEIRANFVLVQFLFLQTKGQFISYTIVGKSASGFSLVQQFRHLTGTGLQTCLSTLSISTTPTKLDFFIPAFYEVSSNNS